MAKIITIYFSKKGQTIGPGMKMVYQEKGNTEMAAEFIQQAVGGDLFEIHADRDYSEDHMVLIEEAKQELNAGTRVPVKEYPENLEQYDTIFLGYPNWWSDVPMAVYTFLESYDFKDKTLVPFNTSASGGFGRSLDGIAESAAGATILEGIALTEGELADAQNAVTEWLAALEVN